MAERVTKSARWTADEWAVVEEAAGMSGSAPATFVRQTVLASAAAVMARRESGLPAVIPGQVSIDEALAVPAAPEERESGRRGGSMTGSVPAATVPGAGGTGGSTGSASSRPVGSAGSSGSAVPPAAGPVGAASSSSGAAPAAGTLHERVVGMLTERFGARADHPAHTRKLIADGRVTVYGDVVRSPSAPVAEGDDVRIA